MTQAALDSLEAKSPLASEAKSPLASDSQRLLVIGGVLLIASGMLFGDVFAMFVLHPNNARIGEAMVAAAQLIPAGDADGILAHFMAVGGFLENRGTKVDTHTHIIHMGYIALLLAMLQPWVALSAAAKRRVAWLYIVSAALLPVSIFSIYYVGLAYSPLSHIGWGSILADLFGALLAVALLIQLWGLWCQVRAPQESPVEPAYIGSDDPASRFLLVAGLLLLVSGFLYGAGYAAWTQSGAASSEVEILKAIVSHAAASQQALLDADFGAFGTHQMYRAINIAVHTHINEMGILLLLMSFVQGFIHYSERTRRRWAQLAVVSGFALPIGILLEIKLGIVGSIVADLFGFTMIVSLMAMLFGLLRYTGALDVEKGEAA
ncbi:MAG: hypothetical protein O7F73_12000 [Gammaproteobacteria bacterium]|nr:hypothetical protein [Gammaproteobacteria bacterium]